MKIYQFNLLYFNNLNNSAKSSKIDIILSNWDKEEYHLILLCIQKIVYFVTLFNPFPQTESVTAKYKNNYYC